MNVVSLLNSAIWRILCCSGIFPVNNIAVFRSKDHKNGEKDFDVTTMMMLIMCRVCYSRAALNASLGGFFECKTNAVEDSVCHMYK